MTSAVASMPRATALVERIVLWATRVFTFAAFFAFLVAGVASAVVTAIAEYRVVRSFNERHASLVVSFSVLVVFVLEASKTFLIFLNSEYADRKNAKYDASRTMFRVIRYCLVGVSFLLMLAYTLHSLSNPNYAREVSRTEQRMAGEQTTQLAALDSGFAARKAAQAALDDEDVELWRKKMEFEMNNVVGTTWEGKYFAAHKRRWEEAKQRRVENESRLNGEWAIARTALDQRFRQEFAQARQQLRTDVASRNEVLSGALEVVTGSSAYSTRLYSLLAGLVSVLLSFVLEATMWVVFTTLAILYGEAFSVTFRTNEAASSYAAASLGNSRMDEADMRAFHDKVVREKRSARRVLRDLIQNFWSR